MPPHYTDQIAGNPTSQGEGCDGCFIRLRRPLDRLLVECERELCPSPFHYHGYGLGAGRDPRYDLDTMKHVDHGASVHRYDGVPDTEASLVGATAWYNSFNLIRVRIAKKSEKGNGPKDPCSEQDRDTGHHSDDADEYDLNSNSVFHSHNNGGACICTNLNNGTMLLCCTRFARFEGRRKQVPNIGPGCSRQCQHSMVYLRYIRCIDMCPIRSNSTGGGSTLCVTRIASYTRRRFIPVSCCVTTSSMSSTNCTNIPYT